MRGHVFRATAAGFEDLIDTANTMHLSGFRIITIMKLDDETIAVVFQERPPTTGENFFEG